MSQLTNQQTAVAHHSAGHAKETRKARPAFGKELMQYREALHRCLSAVEENLPTEELPLEQSLDRVLRRRQICEVYVPPWHRSMMDGYAVRSSDVRGASPERPVELPQVDEVPAGRVSAITLGPGQAIRIMTGACVPDGADAVVKLENTCRRENRVQFYDAPGENPYIVPKGQDLSPGTIVAEAGNMVTPAMMGVLSSCGIQRIAVSCKPRVAIIPTGNELAPPGNPVIEGQIYDINSRTLFGLCLTTGAEPVNAGIVQDKASDLLKMLNRHMDKDIILLSGGVSVGDYDIVHETLVRAGVKEIFWRVKVQPGKPLFFGRRNNTLIYGLPGNPVSSFVNFHLFVRPVIDKLLGKPIWGNEIVAARVTGNRIIKPGRRKFLRGRMVRNGICQEVEILAEQRSSVFSPMLDTDALVEVPEDANLIRKGEVVTVHLLNRTYA